MQKLLQDAPNFVTYAQKDVKLAEVENNIPAADIW